MKDCAQAMSMASLPPPSLPKTVFWVFGHFGLFILLLMAGTWDFLLGYTTMLQFEDNVQDFGRFYYATKAFLDNQDMYGPTPGTFTPMTPLFGQHLWNLNPPHVHLFFYPLILFSPHQALAIWATGSIAAFILCTYLVISELGISLSFTQWNFLLIGILAFSATGFLIRTAQVPLILMVPLTLSWLSARKGNWTKSGLYLGLLASAKLFFLIFLPYLLLRRAFRGSATFVIAFLSCMGLGLFVFGLPSYLSWLQVLTKIDWVWISNNTSLLGFLTRSFSDNPLYQPLMTNVNIYPIFIFLIGLVGGMTIFATAWDSTPNATDRGFAILLLGSLLISPVAWTYYFFFPLGPLAALVNSWKNEKYLESNRFHQRSLSLRKLFLFIGIPGLLLPSTMGTMFQPNSVATLILASGYFWTTLALWSALITDWYAHKEV